MGAFVKEHTVAVSLSHRGFAKRLPIDTFRVQGRGGTGVKGGKVQGEDDFIAQLLVCGSHDDLMFFTDTGRVFVKKAYEVPEASRTSAGRSVRQLLELKENESIVSMLALEDFRGSEQAPVVICSLPPEAGGSNAQLSPNSKSSIALVLSL